MTVIERTLFDSDHEIFRDTVRRFVEDEIAPFHAQWEKDGKISREAWLKAGELGLLCASMPEEYGGGGVERTYSVILLEELARAGATGPGFGLHSEIVAPYINRYGSEEQKRKFLPKMAKGEFIGAIAMTEPGTGSDLQGVRTTAIKDGNELVINGAKTFITNGEMSDVVIVVAKTDPDAGAKGISLVLVEADREGFRKGRNLEKIGLKAQDTSELFFDDVRVPMTNLLGEEGKGFIYLMQELAWERLQLSISAVANTEAAVEWTIDYTKQREAFGQPIMDFQNTRFKLAEVKTQATVARTFVDRLIALMLEDKLDAETAAMAKWWTSDTQCKVIDECLQLHGGYGYMWEFPIARAWADARIQRIYAGTNEIMKEIIGRSL
ncbi:MAG: acyl-CoA dehydrogenase family protein [Alphaproteobacteria bacterium]|jgi:acyl-CoA dehydrogenase|nr:acyl-CoA dehydrogenase family protein [Alphaproteobacteria bacterium]